MKKSKGATNYVLSSCQGDVNVVLQMTVCNVHLVCLTLFYCINRCIKNRENYFQSVFAYMSLMSANDVKIRTFDLICREWRTYSLFQDNDFQIMFARWQAISIFISITFHTNIIKLCIWSMVIPTAYWFHLICLSCLYAGDLLSLVCDDLWIKLPTCFGKQIAHLNGFIILLQKERDITKLWLVFILLSACTIKVKIWMVSYFKGYNVNWK